MIEFELDGAHYKTLPIPAKTQGHLVRRLFPVVLTLVPAFAALVKAKEAQGPMLDILAPLSGLFEPFAAALADMKDEHFEYVYDVALGALQRKVGDNFVPVYTQSKVLMFSDLNDLGKQIHLIVRVLQDSLGPFMRGLLTGPLQTEAKAAAA
jgi:hypothetical protein